MSKRINSHTFEQWFRANFNAREIRGLAEHGADTGWPHITYTSDCVKIFDRFGDEIWETACEAADDCGMTVCFMVAGFRRNDMTYSLANFKNLMVWFACEELANRIVSGKEHAS